MLYTNYFASTVGGQTSGTGFSLNWFNDTIKVALLSSSYTPNQDSHVTLADVVLGSNEVSGTGYTSGGATLTTPTVTINSSTHTVNLGGATTQWTSSTISGIRYAVIYKSTGTASTSPLIALIDFGSSISTTSGSFVITWSSNGIVSLTAN